MRLLAFRGYMKTPAKRFTAGLYKRLLLQVYQQDRINQARGIKHRAVDVLISANYAKAFHDHIQRGVNEYKWSLFNMTARVYNSEHFDWPRCEINILIPDGKWNIISVADHQAGTYFDLLDNKSKEFPERKQWRASGWQVISTKPELV